MKNMMKKLLVAVIMMSGITGFSAQASGPFTNFLKTIWNFPCSIISEEVTSALFIVGTTLLSYEGIKYWLKDANDKLYFVKKWGESAYQHPQITMVLSLLTVISIACNKQFKETNKKSDNEKNQNNSNVQYPVVAVQQKG